MALLVQHPENPSITHCVNDVQSHLHTNNEGKYPDAAVDRVAYVKKDWSHHGTISQQHTQSELIIKDYKITSSKH
jgi:hypothetical protein